MSELPRGWNWATVAQLATISGGITQNAKRAAYPIKRPFLRVANVYADQLRLDQVEEIGVNEAEIERALLKRNDLLVVEGNGSLEQIGRVAVWDGSIDGCLHQNHLIKIRSDGAQSARWMLHWLLSPDGRRAVQAVASSTTGLHTLSISKVSALRVPVASVGEQAKILDDVESYLSRLDAAVASLTQTQTKLKAYRAAVLKAAVEGRLVPTEAQLAKAEGRTYEPATNLLKRIIAERGGIGGPSKVESAQMPEGWTIASLEELLSAPLSHGRSVPDATTGAPVLRLTAIKGGKLNLSERKIGAWSFAEAEPFLVREGDFLVSRGNGSLRLVGRGALVDTPPDKVAFPDTLIRVCVSGLYSRRLLSRLWNSGYIRSQIENRAKTTAGIYKINQADLRAILIPVPPEAEQSRLLEALDEVLSIVDDTERSVGSQITRCARLRQSILKAAFEGQLVDQDPNDEPAAELLARLRATPEPAAKSKRGRKPKTA